MDSISIESFVSAADAQVSSELAGEVVILNFKSGVYYGLDSVGFRVWALLQKPISVKAIEEILLAEYDVEPARCRSDLLILLQSLASESLIKVTYAPSA